MPILIFLMTCVLSLVWSSQRLMWNDEFLSFYTDSMPTVRDVVEVQLYAPISLDPPTYHLLSHLAMDVVGRNAMALRLPALMGFLLMQVSLYFFVRRIAGERAAVVAMSVPLLTASFRYAVEGRPYALLLGLYALALLCWQRVAEEVAGRWRGIWLAGLALAIGLAITSHYFGVLILLPVGCAEIARSLRRRLMDAGVVVAMAVGASSVGLILPFERALLPYRQHYYMQAVSWHSITQGYRELFLRYTTWPIAAQKIAAAGLALAAICLVVAAVRRSRRGGNAEPVEIWVALAGLFVLPVFGYLFGRFVTHTMEVRYVIAALIAFAVALGIVLKERVRSDLFYCGLMVAILGGAVIVNGLQIKEERRESQLILSSFRLSPEVSAALRLHPEERIYVQSLNDFYLDTFYAPDAELRSRFVYLYAQGEEIQWLGHDTNYVTAVNMGRFAPLRVLPYAEFVRLRSPLLVLSHSGWEWVEKDLAARRVSMEPLGHGLRGDFVRVKFP